MTRIVRIGGACAFYGDSSVAPAQLLRAGVDYLILDYLAEATMSTLGAMRRRRDNLGYATDFTEWVWKDNLAELKRTGTKIVTNAGGVNPRACLEQMERYAREAGLSFRIAIVEGDDVSDRLEELASQSELFTSQPFPPVDKVVTANAYLGASPIARALAMGADVVITGRCVDSALTLGILMHEFGWKTSDLDLLAQGSLAGHVIECGAQATGGLFTDWEDVPDWANIGYPIIECEADGSFTVTKPEGTGGLVSSAVVAEQIVYEIDDPQVYKLPDVVCDFAKVRVEQTGPDRVRVTGATGYPSTGHYKVCITWADGFRAIGFMPVVGRDASKKAQRQAEAVLDRVNGMLRAGNVGPFRASRIEIIGAETSYGANARAGDTREVIYKLAVEHDEKAAFAPFLREFDSPTTSMSAGTTGWFGGRAEAKPVMRVFSCTVEQQSVAITISLGEQSEVLRCGTEGDRFNPQAVPRIAEGPSVSSTSGTIEVPLVELAWARSGDKGDAFNVGVIARNAEYLPVLRAALTEVAVRGWFQHEFEDEAKAEVVRYELPGLDALNFHVKNSLGGGQFASLRLDPLAKGKAQQLLDFPVSVPADLASKFGLA
jgi:hypothetical protein